MPYKTLIKEQFVKTEAISGFICDRCGVEHSTEDIIEMQEAFHYRTTGGYGSLWGDGTTVEVVLCQKCATELLSEFMRKIESDWSGSDLCA